MYLLGLLVLFALVYFIFFKKKKQTTTKGQGSQEVGTIYTPPREQSSNTSQGGATSFLPPISTGYQIFANNLPVAGIQHRKADALNFARSSNQELSLEREPTNQLDPNAIKLIGLSGSKQYFIGYLPKELSEQIVSTGMLDSIKARLARIYVGKNDFIEIQYQVIGPKAEKKKFEAFLNNQLADSEDKDYFKFFGLPIPKGLTAGQAKQAIAEHRKTCKPEEHDEWVAYTHIWEEFDDSEFRESYDLKKVSKAVLTEAINQLRQEGKTYKYLEVNIDDIVEIVIKLKPELEKQT